MIDIKYIRDNLADFKKHVEDRGVDSNRYSPEKLINVYDQWTEKKQEFDRLKSEQNKDAKEFRNLSDQEKQENIERAGKRKKQIQEIEKEVRQYKIEYDDLMEWMPNKINPNMPVGQGEDENEVLETWIPGQNNTGKDGGKRSSLAKDFDMGQMPTKPIHAKEEFSPKDHLTLGESLDIIDVKQSAKVAGSRFAYLKGDGAKLQYALTNFLMKELIRRDFIPMVPPILVKEPVLFGTSHFPEGRDQVYKVESKFIEDKNNLYLAGSSEPPNFAYFMDKILKADDLPQKIVASTTCFRTEVGSWGKDVRGIKRVHQFDKIEMDVVCTPEQSEEIYQELLEINKWFWQQLKIPYRIVNKCTGDAGYLASYQQADVEAWLPSQNTFMEVATDTNTLDYQARRLNIKFRDKEGKKAYVHTINDTGCAIGRTIIAILDNYQQMDGKIKIPDVLRDYMGKTHIG